MESNTHIPTYREKSREQQERTGAYTPVHMFEDLLYRHCPRCHSKHCKKNGRSESGRQRYLCKHCDKGFIVTMEAVDTETMFREYYDDYFKDKRPDMVNAKHPIMHTFYNDERVKVWFKKCISEVEYCNDPDLIDEQDFLAFVKSCELAARINDAKASRHKDSWMFLLNNHNGDVIYSTENYAYTLAYRYGVKLSARQLEEGVSILRCDKCGSQDLSKHGFNNTGRRRIKCNACGHRSVIRAAHIVSESDLIGFCKNYFATLTRDEELIGTITKKMVSAFRAISKSRSFNRLVSMQDVITPYTKERILRAFLGVQIARGLHRSDTFDLLERNMDLKDKISASGRLENVNIDILQSLVPVNMDFFVFAPDIDSEEDIKLGDITYQFGAQIIDHNFYDCQEHIDRSYEEMRRRHK